MSRSSFSSLYRLAMTMICLFHVSACAATSNLSSTFKSVDPSVVVVHTATSHSVRSPTGKLLANTERGLGSGVIISKEGDILTAAHVVQTADKLQVKLYNGKTYDAQVVSSMPVADLALIRLLDPPENLTISKLGDSDKIDVGEPVFVVGTPYGVEHTLTAGYVSALRSMNLTPLDGPLELIQTDAAINQGNSGGPLFNYKGELMGIVSHIRSQSGGNEGLGFAISINVVKEQLINKPAFWSGLELTPVKDTLARALNIPAGDGFIVQSVAKNSVGDRLGLRAGTVPIHYGGLDFLIGGDIITRIGNQNIYLTEQGMETLFKKLRELREQDTFTVTVYREGKEITLSTPLTQQP